VSLMTESVWNHRSGGQRFSAPPMAYGQPFNQRPLPSHSNSEYSQSGYEVRTAQYGEPFGGRLRSRSIQGLASLETVPGPEEHMINEKAVVIDVHRRYGRILSPTNIRMPNVHIFFSLKTFSGNEPLSAVTNNLSEIFEVGDQVEIGIEEGFDVSGALEECHTILTCATILQICDEAEHPKLIPFLMVQEGGEMPLAVTKRCGLVGVHPQVLPNPAVINAFLENASTVSIPQVDWPEFAMVGHSVEGRTIRAPRWLNGTLNGTQQLERIALTLQRFGRDVSGFAIVKGVMEVTERRGRSVLTPIDKDDLNTCGEIFFPFEIRRIESSFDYRKVYAAGSKWYFRACRELPGRRFKYRAYLLDDLNGTMPRHSELPEIGAQDDQRDQNPAAQVVTETAAAAARSACHTELKECSCCLDFVDNEASQLVDINMPEMDAQSSATPVQKSSMVSDSTMRLLSEVDFSHPENLLDVEEPLALKQSLMPLQPSSAQAAICCLSRSQPNNEFFSSTTVLTDQNAASAQNSAATARSESCVSSARSSSISVESTQPCCAVPNTVRTSSTEIVHGDGETLLLHSTPPPIVANVVGVAPLESDAVDSTGEHSLPILLIGRNSWDGTLTLSSESEIVRKYNVFDESSASTMHFEILSRPKRTFEEELIGCLEDEEPYDTPVKMAPLSELSLVGDLPTPCAPFGNNGDGAREQRTKAEKVAAEVDFGGVQFVKKNETLADALLRVENNDHTPCSAQVGEEDFAAESSEEEDACRIVRGRYPIRVQRRPNDNEVSEVEQRGSSFSSVDTGLVKAEKEVQHKASGSPAVSALSAVLHSDDMFFYRAYESALARHPFITQVVSAGSLAGVGDAFSQLVVEERWRKGGYDAVRTARFVGVISVWVAPILYRWFGVLERVSGRASIVPMKRMLIDQAVMAPCLTSTVITGLHLVEGNKPRDALLRARREIVPVLITNYKALLRLLQVWPFVQLFNFYVVPLRYRIVLLQFVGIFWNAYLSFMTQSAQSAMVDDRAKSENHDGAPTTIRYHAN
ncbi:Protein Mpv17, partial [Toxocara canis]